MTFEKYLPSTLCVLLLAALVAAPSALGQSMRSGDGFYVRQQLGVSSYLGDNEQSPFNYNYDAYEVDNKIPFNLGVEAGYQIAPAFAVGLAYNLGEYPVIFQQNNAVEPYESVNTLRHAGALMGRYTLNADDWLVAPYIQAGFNASYSSADELNDNWAYGPSAGVGLDIALSGRTSLMVEYTAHSSLDDSAIDLNEGDGFGSFDYMSAVTAGLKYNFSSPFVAVAISGINGPQELTVGEEGLFVANTNVESASTPVDYTWRLGDGTTANGLSTRHAFATPGTYEVTFMASNEDSEAMESMMVTVVAPPAPAMITGLMAMPQTPDTNTPVAFEAAVAGDAPLTYQWTFGDGTTSTEANPTHTYTEPGTYPVTLKTTNAAGADVATTTVTVMAYEPAYCATIADMNVVYFEENSSILTNEARMELEENAAILNDCGTLDATISGMAAPSERNAESLAEARARAVQAFYADQDIDTDRIQLATEMAPSNTTMKVDGSQYRRALTTPTSDMSSDRWDD